MHILVLVVCYEEYLHRILSRLSPTEVRGATVVESTGTAVS